ncbi:MAG: DUF4149 domain-containing protein [Deltaproteobacteria bacterium]|jgi:uncharacterized membrane protein
MLLRVALFLHVIAAIFWVGGMLFLTLVVAPYLISIPDPKERSKIYQVVGKKYRFFGWVAIITLLVTGPIILYTLYGIDLDAAMSPSFYGSRLGTTLYLKLALVVVIVLSSLLHDFWIGPKAKTSPALSRYARIFGRGNLVIALLIVMVAVMLRAGGL